MFRHSEKSRTYEQNLKIASYLSFVAGLVNVGGLMAVHVLTTNITGHFAFFAEEIVQKGFGGAYVFLIYTVAFLTGAFLSGVLIEVIYRVNERYIYIIPILIESSLLFIVAVWGQSIAVACPYFVASLLLLAMGIQNALVTRISSAVVRTTHLTGMFTDLGIELSQLLFYKKAEEHFKLRKSVKLRFRIILFFFIGGVLSGYAFDFINYKVFYFGLSILVWALTFDYLRFRYFRIKRFFTRKRSRKHRTVVETT